MMFRKHLLALALLLLGTVGAAAQNCPGAPFTFTPNTTILSSQVNANFASMVNCANVNLAHNGANSDITSLSGLTTPLSIPQGGTGAGTVAANLVFAGPVSGAAAAPAFRAAVIADFPSIANNTILGNVSGGAAAPAAIAPSLALDVIGSTQGMILYRGASAWAALATSTSGLVLQTKGAGANPAYGMSAWNETVYTSHGTNTFTPAAGVTQVFVACVGAGGGGGGGTGASTSTMTPGGGAGGYSEGPVAVTPSVGVTVTIGTGGAGGTNAPTNGSAGTDSSFGASIVAKGGGGGAAASQFGSAGGAGGLASGGTGTLKINGTTASDAISNTGTTALTCQSPGGMSVFGGGGKCGSGGGNAGTAPGAGGGGGFGTTGGIAGGAGADGACIIKWLL